MIRIEHECALLNVEEPVVVIYRDDGPGGPCGQSVEATMPKASAYGPMSYDDARELVLRLTEVDGGRNARVRLISSVPVPEGLR